MQDLDERTGRGVSSPTPANEVNERAAGLRGHPVTLITFVKRLLGKNNPLADGRIPLVSMRGALLADYLFRASGTTLAAHEAVLEPEAYNPKGDRAMEKDRNASGQQGGGQGGQQGGGQGGQRQGGGQGGQQGGKDQQGGQKSGQQGGKEDQHGGKEDQQGGKEDQQGGQKSGQKS